MVLFLATILGALVAILPMLSAFVVASSAKWSYDPSP